MAGLVPRGASFKTCCRLINSFVSTDVNPTGRQLNSRQSRQRLTLCRIPEILATPKQDVDHSALGRHRTSRLLAQTQLSSHHFMNYFDHHGTLLLFCLAIFPRLTLLLASISSGGFLCWLGWLFCPHFLVAILALPYWRSNPVLVIVAWLCAISGTGGEGAYVNKRR